MPDEKKIYAKPAEGRTVPLVDGSAWPAEGAWVDLNDRYYRRRLADEDIVETDPPAEPETVEQPTADGAEADPLSQSGETSGAPAAGDDDDSRAGSGRRKNR